MWGQFVAIEVKAQGGRLRRDQIKELHAIRDCNGVAIVAEELEDVKRVMVMVKAKWTPVMINSQFKIPELPPLVSV